MLRDMLADTFADLFGDMTVWALEKAITPLIEALPFLLVTLMSVYVPLSLINKWLARVVTLFLAVIGMITVYGG